MEKFSASEFSPAARIDREKENTYIAEERF